MGGGDACGLRHCDLRWSSYGATKRVRGVLKLVAETHEATPTGALVGVPDEATKLVRGVPTWVAGTHVATLTGALGGTPFYGVTKRVRGVPKWVAGTHAAIWALSGAPNGATKGGTGWGRRMRAPP